MSSLNCRDLLSILDFESSIISKARYILGKVVLSKKIKWRMDSDTNLQISKLIIKIFKKLNIEVVYDEKNKIFVVNQLEKEIIALLYCAIVIVTCYVSELSVYPYLIFKNIDYHSIFNRETNYFVQTSEIKSYISLFNSFYEFSLIEDKIKDKSCIMYLRELKYLINSLMTKITLKEFDDESSSFIDNLSKYRLTPTNNIIGNSQFSIESEITPVKPLLDNKRIIKIMSFDSEVNDLSKYIIQIVSTFTPISPSNSVKYSTSPLLVPFSAIV